jgi:hypothetical protein
MKVREMKLQIFTKTISNGKPAATILDRYVTREQLNITIGNYLKQIVEGIPITIKNWLNMQSKIVIAIIILMVKLRVRQMTKYPNSLEGVNPKNNN